MDQIKNSQPLTITNFDMTRFIMQMSEAIDLVLFAFKSGNKILICGNGGSAADAQHFAAEFINIFSKEIKRPALPAISLASDTSVITAIANDIGYDDVFSFQLSMKGSAGNILVAISASGNSPNIVKAIKKAKELNMDTIAFVGFDGGKAKELADYQRLSAQDTKK